MTLPRFFTLSTAAVLAILALIHWPVECFTLIAAVICLWLAFFGWAVESLWKVGREIDDEK